MKNMSLLKVRCLGRGWGPCFRVSVMNSMGCCVYDRCLCPGQWDTISLPSGHYEVRSRNYVGLEPRGFTRWVELHPGHESAVEMLFRRPVWPQSDISFTVRDARYSNIVPMNGGITVCLKQTR